MRLRLALGIALTASAAVAVTLAATATADNNTGATMQTSVATGAVTLSATSGAPQVQFTVDGTALAPTNVSGGSAQVTIATWGRANGTHSASVRDCPTSACTGNGSSGTFVVANPAPSITSPTDGASVTGGFTVRASTQGGALRLLVDGRSAGFADGPAYSFAHTTTALSPGKHTLQVLACSSDHSWCSGPTSTAVTITSLRLRPSVSVSPASISPNRDGVQDSTSVRYVLDRSETVVISVLTSRGHAVLTLPAQRLGAGAHHWRWYGTDARNRVVADGTYSIRVAVSARVGGPWVTGVASTPVRVDTRRPSVYAISGAGSTIYPYRDGYRDTFTTTMRLAEPARVTLIVRNARGRIVGSASTTGTTSASDTWSGLVNGRPAPAGRYTWTLRITDAAGNHATTRPRTLYVSGSRLVRHTVTLTQPGRGYTTTQLSSGCAGASTADSVYRGSGVLLRTTCSPNALGPQVAAADYTFTLPAALSYGELAVRAVGSSVDAPSQIEASIPTGTGGDVTLTSTATVGSSARSTYQLGSVSGPAYVSDRQVHLVLSVDDLHTDSNGAGASSFDVDAVQLIVTYYTLG